MRIGLALLCFAYVLSQFYRTFLAVLTGPLAEDIGAGPEDLALASGLWFLVFAAMQVPVGSALDRVGPGARPRSCCWWAAGAGRWSSPWRRRPGMSRSPWRCWGSAVRRC